MRFPLSARQRTIGTIRQNAQIRPVMPMMMKGSKDIFDNATQIDLTLRFLEFDCCQWRVTNALHVMMSVGCSFSMTPHTKMPGFGWRLAIVCHHRELMGELKCTESLQFFESSFQ